ncbi:hypothetical protein RO3G_00862 [Rhizopus delemar RA 99-880]|uniref:Uncharacterized protein n=1 Tax=Rhizopus delemar (strain RA 99-880 / ATCC MYA-4621 / FGSC 9543 / NRRL 43880) TaxID=246409 RepID=I1BIX8_RHIO9|nr:hypothetical protein RO3G_00862 [Rhizopus delemar RA 99-880]|eukprot:EIE76158.1 hypothetical protein RO3G_00862 [Rhizopus delemar RA 99-880]
MYTTIQHVEAFEETNWPVQALAMLTELGETDVKLEVDDEVAHLIYGMDTVQTRLELEVSGFYESNIML